jgi:plastocyanin
MSKKIIRVVVGFSLLVALMLASCGPAAPGKEETKPTAPSGVEHQVAVTEFDFEPSEITINIGDTITWINKGTQSHYPTGSNFDAGHIHTGKALSKTFDEAGIYDYSCYYHTYMKGKIVVE